MRDPAKCKAPGCRKWSTHGDYCETCHTDNLLDELGKALEVDFSMITPCECGAQKVGSDRHSYWCPRYED